MLFLCTHALFVQSKLKFLFHDKQETIDAFDLIKEIRNKKKHHFETARRHGSVLEKKPSDGALNTAGVRHDEASKVYKTLPQDDWQLLLRGAKVRIALCCVVYSLYNTYVVLYALRSVIIVLRVSLCV